MRKRFVFGAVLLLSVACASAGAPTPAPTATPPPTPAPTATPMPTATPKATVTPTIAVAPEPPAGEHEYDQGLLVAVFPEIGEKMKEIRPVYTAYFHSDDWHAPGKNTTVDEVFKLLKMENIATHEGHKQIRPAMIVDVEPDLIIADSIDAVVKNPDLSGLHMIEDTAHIPHHIFVMREGYSFYVADPGFRNTVQAFAAFAYPDTFVFEEKPADDHGEEEKDETGDEHTHGQGEGGHGHSHGH